MNPYPPISCWHVPADALQVTLEGVIRGGLHSTEAGALWLGRRMDVARIATVVLPKGRGVVEEPWRWQVGPEVICAITRWARPQGLVMLAMLHTHLGGSVAMSWSDRNRVVQVPGMLSVIIGHRGADHDPNRWGWYVYDHGAYRELSPGERQRRIVIDDGRTCVARIASSDGVHEIPMS